MPLLYLRAFVTCKKGETYLPTYILLNSYYVLTVNSFAIFNTASNVTVEMTSVSNVIMRTLYETTDFTCRIGII
jgi:hypothetical protein